MLKSILKQIYSINTLLFRYPSKDLLFLSIRMATRTDVVLNEQHIKQSQSQSRLHAEPNLGQREIWTAICTVSCVITRYSARTSKYSYPETRYKARFKSSIYTIMLNQRVQKRLRVVFYVALSYCY